MSRKNVLVIAGSPSPHSRSSRLLLRVRDLLTEYGVDAHTYSLDSFDAHALLHAHADHPKLAEFEARATQADGLLLGTPVYKASYTGGLKAIVDLIPYEALVGKVAFGLATARQRPHVDSTAEAYTQLFKFFRIGTEVPAATFLDDEVFVDANAEQFSTLVEQTLDKRARAIIQALGT